MMQQADDISTPSTATTSATSLVVAESLSYSYIPNSASTHDMQDDCEHLQENEASSLNKPSLKRLNSESYKTAIQNTSDNLLDNHVDTKLDQIQSYTDNLSVASNQNQYFSNTITSTVTNNNGSSVGPSASSIAAYKRQEANFYVQQVLTNLLALGVLEFESGFENAINKTFKVINAL